MEDKKKLKVWNLEPFKNGNLFACLIIGARESGKSHLIKHLYRICQFDKYYDKVIVFCNSGEIYEYYCEFVFGNLIFKEFRKEILENIMKLSEMQREKGKPKKYLIIFDDSVGYDEKNCDSILQIYATGRHFNISIIFCSQRLLLTNTTARCNSDVIFIGRLKSANERKTIIDQFFKGSITVNSRQTENNIYNEIVNNYTMDYNFIALDFSNNKMIDFYDTTYYYKA